MVERSLCMREVQGSIPCISIFLCLLANFSNMYSNLLLIKGDINAHPSTSLYIPRALEVCMHCVVEI